MEYNIYAIRDEKTGFLSPTLDGSDEQAMRNFEHAIQTSTGLLKSHKKDFSLYRIGRYDTDHASLTAEYPIVLVLEGANINV